MDEVFNRVARRRRGGQGGFTLIELLVVIAVLAILAAIVIFNVVGVTNRGKSSSCQTDVKTIQTAMDAYYNDQTPPGWNGQFTANTYNTAGGADPFPVFDPLVPNYVHSNPGTNCSQIIITDNTIGTSTSKTVTGT